MPARKENTATIRSFADLDIAEARCGLIQGQDAILVRECAGHWLEAVRQHPLSKDSTCA
jgi:hypothetical protein